MDTECESLVTETELPGNNDRMDESEGNGDNGEAIEEMG